MTTGTCPRCRYAVLEDFPSCPGCSRRLRRALVDEPERPPAVDPLDGWRPEVVDQPLAIEPVALLPVDAMTSLAVATVTVTACLVAMAAAAQATILATDLWPVVGLSDSTLATLHEAQATVRLAATATAPFAVIALAAWTAVATANLARLGIGHRRFRAISAGVAWFVPVANVVLAKLAVDDVWRGSSARLAPVPSAAWRRRPVGEVVHLWWVCLLGAPLAALAADRLAAPTATSQSQVALACAVAAVALAVTAISATKRVVTAVAGSQLLRSHVVAVADPAGQPGRAHQTT